MSLASSPLSHAEIDELCQRLIATEAPLRIFGYGSIIWLPSFHFSSRTVGRVLGYKRRFYQGSVSHRGTAQCPGRVATLVPSSRPDAATWGVAFEVRGAAAIRAAVAHLTERELLLGGYRFYPVSFLPHHPDRQPQQLEAFAYIADAASSPHYLGKAAGGLDEQARQVAAAVGPSGANIDYVRGVALFLLREVPDGPARDRHVFELLRRAESCLAAAESLLPDAAAASLTFSSSADLPPVVEAPCVSAF